ncbi:MAG: DUF4956 domain-containing protein [bacterium]
MVNLGYPNLLPASLEGFFQMIFHFSFNFLIIFIIIRLLYYPVNRRKNYIFTYLLVSTVVFFLCYLLENVKLQLGFALGLFAIFGILRYRTSTITIKEMTYLFIVIGISVINALAQISFPELMFANFMIIIITLFLEKKWLLKQESQKTIVYEKINLIKPENHHLLKEDLEDRTGLTINKIEIGSIDFLKDIATIRIYYYDKNNLAGHQDEEETKKNEYT